MASIFVQVHGLREVKTGDLVLVSSSREGKNKEGEGGKKVDTVHHVSAREARKGVYKVTDLFSKKNIFLKKNLIIFFKKNRYPTTTVTVY